MRLTELMLASTGYEEVVAKLPATNSRAAFQWGGTIFALLLLIQNRMAEQSLPKQTSLLVFYLITSLPNALFSIVRGSFGSWLSLIALVANLYFPESFPVARVVLFVIMPDYVTRGLRDTSAGVVFCFVIGVFVGLAKLRFIGDLECNCHSICYFLSISFLIYFTMTPWLYN